MATSLQVTPATCSANETVTLPQTAEHAVFADLVDALLLGRLHLVASECLGLERSRFVFQRSEVPLLTARERQLLKTASDGVANKVIAIEHAMSFSNASHVVKGAVTKLGFRHLAQFLATVARLRAPRATNHEGFDGERTEVTFCSEGYASLDPRLSRAEREIVGHLLQGANTSDIASLRGTSKSTVSNQLRAIYCKLGVSSRRELCVHYGQPLAGAA